MTAPSNLSALFQLQPQAGGTVQVFDGGSNSKSAIPDWAQLSGKPAVFPPSEHTHAYSDFTDYQAEHGHAWSAITATPTTLADYGITDACLITDSRLSDARTPITHNHEWSAITATPTTLAGYGITDACLITDSRLSDARTPITHNHAWSAITATPTTRAGYGITDAAPLIHGVATSYIPVATSTSAWGASILKQDLTQKCLYLNATAGIGQDDVIYQNGSSISERAWWTLKQYLPTTNTTAGLRFMARKSNNAAGQINMMMDFTGIKNIDAGLIYTSGAYPLGLGSNDLISIWISPGGKVGIGTSPTDSKLEVKITTPGAEIMQIFSATGFDNKLSAVYPSNTIGVFDTVMAGAYGANGGLKVTGMASGTSMVPGLRLQGIIGYTGVTSSIGVCEFGAALGDGINSAAPVGATDNAFMFRNNGARINVIKGNGAFGINCNTVGAMLETFSATTEPAMYMRLNGFSNNLQYAAYPDSVYGAFDVASAGTYAVCGGFKITGLSSGVSTTPMTIQGFDGFADYNDPYTPRMAFNVAKRLSGQENLSALEGGDFAFAFNNNGNTMLRIRPYYGGTGRGGGVEIDNNQANSPVNGIRFLGSTNVEVPALGTASARLLKAVDANGKIELATAGTDYIAGAHNHAWGEITSRPATLAGYGITDAEAAGAASAVQSNLNNHAGLTTAAHGLGATAFHPDAFFSLASHAHAWSDITSGKPTTRAGYGITDAAAASHAHAWSDITSGKPTTRAGYGITDAEVAGAASTVQGNLNNHTGLTTTAHGLGASAFHADSFFIPSSTFLGWTDISSNTINGFSSFTKRDVRYIKIFGFIFIVFALEGTSDNTYIAINVPYYAASMENVSTGCKIKDNGVAMTTPGVAWFHSNQNTLWILKNFAGDSFTSSGIKSAYGQIFCKEL